MRTPYIRDIVLRPLGKDCKIIQRSSTGMESVELRSPLGEDNKTIPSFKRILMAGRSHTSCNI